HGYDEEGNKDFRDVARTVLPRGGSGTQILNRTGHRLVSIGDPVATRPMAPPAAVAAAVAGKQRLLTVRLGHDRQRYRVLVSPVDRLGHRRVLVVAESLDEVEDSVHRVLV